MSVRLTLRRAEVLGTALCAVSIGIVHIAQPELDPIDVAVSYYLNGRWGWVLGVGLVSMGVGSLHLAAELKTVLGLRRTDAGWSLLVIWGVGAIVGGIFPPDPYGRWDQPASMSGLIHGLAGVLAFIAFPPAAWLLSRQLAIQIKGRAQDRALGVLAGLSVLCLVLFVGCLAPVFVNRPPFVLGLVERALIGVNLGWLAVASLIVADVSVCRLTPERRRSSPRSEGL